MINLYKMDKNLLLYSKLTNPCSRPADWDKPCPTGRRLDGKAEARTWIIWLLWFITNGYQNLHFGGVDGKSSLKIIRSLYSPPSQMVDFGPGMAHSQLNLKFWDNGYSCKMGMGLTDSASRLRFSLAVRWIRMDDPCAILCAPQPIVQLQFLPLFLLFFNSFLFKLKNKN